MHPHKNSFDWWFFRYSILKCRFRYHLDLRLPSLIIIYILVEWALLKRKSIPCKLFWYLIVVLCEFVWRFTFNDYGFKREKFKHHSETVNLVLSLLELTSQIFWKVSAEICVHFSLFCLNHSIVSDFVW